ncbi:doxx family protein [uncultured Sulfuricurvum sp.]|uniref:doxx family protein n=1 Tax=uncultured Sulfuricurvum sp. TaxID=430693 RepID=UPI00261F0F48|nr:doxx family protein [uncultured Sulfuricurvum sp.]
MKLETAVKILRIGLGINFLWFGILKFFPGMSPAETLAKMTIDALTFNLVPPGLELLAVWEVAIGVGFITGKYLPYIIRIFMVHMVLTFTPLVLFPELCFTNAPFALTLVGQYIIKNLVFITAGAIICITRNKKYENNDGQEKCTVIQIRENEVPR